MSVVHHPQKCNKIQLTLRTAYCSCHTNSLCPWKIELLSKRLQMQYSAPSNYLILILQANYVQAQSGKIHSDVRSSHSYPIFAPELNVTKWPWTSSLFCLYTFLFILRIKILSGYLSMCLHYRALTCIVSVLSTTYDLQRIRSNNFANPITVSITEDVQPQTNFIFMKWCITTRETVAQIQTNHKACNYDPIHLPPYNYR